MGILIVSVILVYFVLGEMIKGNFGILFWNRYLLDLDGADDWLLFLPGVSFPQGGGVAEV